MNNDIFQFQAYKEFIKARVGPANRRQGVKAAIARAIRCQPTYVSQILNGNAHLSLEQADELADFFALHNDEKKYFLLLLQRDRAGTRRLQEFFSEQINQLLAQRLVLTHRLGHEHSLSKIDQSIYYSSWHYAAIHMAITVPNLREPETLSRKLNIPFKRAVSVLDFLCNCGLATREGLLYCPSQKVIRLGKDSHNIIKHHTNWRNRAIDSLDHEALTDLHYSAIITISKNDARTLKDNLLEFISQNLKMIKASKEEEVCCLNLDLFGLIPPTQD